MEAFFGDLLNWVTAHPLWAGAVLFGIALAESLAVVGVLIPGVAIMFGIGALIGAGGADFWVMCAWAAAGAVIGDGLSYWLGFHYRERLRDMWPFKRMPEAIDQGQVFFERHGTMSVVFGRFFGPIRATVPLVAGMLEMPAGKFVIANVTSALLWAPAYLLPGVVFGASMELASEVAFRLVAVTIAMLALVWSTGWLVHRVFGWLRPHTRGLLQHLLGLGERHASLRRIAAAMGDPEHPEARGLGTFAAILVLAALTLAGLSALLPADLPWADADRMLGAALGSLRTPASDQLIQVFTIQSEWLYLAFLGLIVATMLALFRHSLALWHWTAGLLGVMLIYCALRLLAPDSGIGQLTPDGRTLIAATPLGLLAVISAPAFAERWRWIIYACCTIAVALAVFGNLYLGQSTLSSVISGTLLSSIWIAGLGVAYRTHTRQIPTRLQSVGLLLVAFALPVVIGIMSPAEPVTRKSDITLTETSDWQNRLWLDLPHIRGDLQDSAQSPLNLQYAGTLDWLDQRLEDHGWSRVAATRNSDWLKLLSPSLPLAELPVLPHIHNGVHDAVVWLRPDRSTRQVLRLWPSGYALSGGQPIWLGEVSNQTRHSRLGLFNYAITSEDFSAALTQLREHLPATHQRLKPDGTLLVNQHPFAQPQIP